SSNQSKMFNEKVKFDTQKDKFKPKSSSHHAANSSVPSCITCKQNHLLFQCKSFGELSVEARRNLVKDKQLCFNCLRSGHRISACKSTQTCRKCGQRHNTLLHLENNQIPTPRVNPAPK